MRSAAIVPLLALAFVVGCKDDKKPAPTQTTHAPEPIPSDFVVNSFLDNGPPTELKVKADGGVGIPVEGGAPAQAGDTAAAAGGGAAGVHLLEPGEEPRAARKSEMKQGRAEAIKATVASTVTEEVAGQPGRSGPQPGMAYTFTLTPGGKDPSGDTNIKATFTKVEPQLPPEVDPAQAKQLAQAFKGLSGQVATFRLSPQGNFSNFGMADERIARSELAQVAQQPFEGLFVTLPAEPIGKGAKWEEVTTAQQEGLRATMTTTYTLKEVGPDGLTIGLTTVRKAPAQPYPDPRAPKGTTMSVDGVANGTIKVRLDRVPAKSQIESQTTVTLTQPGGAPGAKGKVVIQKVNVKQNAEAATP